MRCLPHIAYGSFHVTYKYDYTLEPLMNAVLT